MAPSRRGIVAIRLALALVGVPHAARPQGYLDLYGGMTCSHILFGLPYRFARESAADTRSPSD